MSWAESWPSGEGRSVAIAVMGLVGMLSVLGGVVVVAVAVVPLLEWPSERSLKR